MLRYAGHDIEMLDDDTYVLRVEFKRFGIFRATESYRCSTLSDIRDILTPYITVPEGLEVPIEEAYDIVDGSELKDETKPLVPSPPPAPVPSPIRRRRGGNKKNRRKKRRNR